jgi:hypothetical protein
MAHGPIGNSHLAALFFLRPLHQRQFLHRSAKFTDDALMVVPQQLELKIDCPIADSLPNVKL